MRGILACLLIFFTLICSAPFALAEKPVPITDADKWSLWTGGTKLRGANIWQTKSYNGTFYSVGHNPVGPIFTQEDFNRLAAFGANYVNISHPGLLTESAPFRVDLNIQANLDRLLGMIAKADMFAVISFRTGSGRTEFTFSRDEAGDWFKAEQLDDSVWTDRSKQDAWVKMWQYAAKRYRHNPIVAAYDLMVEPNANDIAPGLDDPWDPEEFHQKYSNTLYDWNQFYPRLVNAVREIDTETPILVGGPSYSDIFWLPYLKKSRFDMIVYAVHQYNPYDQYTHQPAEGRNSYPGKFDLDYNGRPDLFNKAWLNDLLSKVDTFAGKKERIAINEFGVIRWVPGADRYLHDLMDLFEQRGWNHALWAWYPASYPSEELEGEFNFLLGSDPGNSKEQSTNTLIRAIQKNWTKNRIRPSGFPAPKNK